MRFIRAAASEVIGLFVGDWAQTLVSIAILAVGWFLLSRFHVYGLAFVLAIALAQSDGTYIQLCPADTTMGPEARGTHQTLMDLARRRFNE